MTLDERISNMRSGATSETWLSKNLSVSTMIAIVAQFVMVVALIVGMRNDIATGKERTEKLETRVEKIAGDGDRIVRLEERLTNIGTTLEKLAVKFETFLDRRGVR